jgi:hypothetical protein
MSSQGQLRRPEDVGFGQEKTASAWSGVYINYKNDPPIEILSIGVGA